jgi:hypothetical protein
MLSLDDRIRVKSRVLVSRCTGRIMRKIDVHPQDM